MVDEVLLVDLHDCGTRYAAAVYVKRPIPDRAFAVVAAIERVRDLSYFNDPLVALGAVLGEPLPELDTFLPDWRAHLERCRERAVVPGRQSTGLRAGKLRFGIDHEIRKFHSA